LTPQARRHRRLVGAADRTHPSGCAAAHGALAQQGGVKIALGSDVDLGAALEIQ